MASYPADANVLQVDDFDALSVVTDKIRDAICNSKFHILSQQIKTIQCYRAKAHIPIGRLPTVSTKFQINQVNLKFNNQNQVVEKKKDCKDSIVCAIGK